MVYAKEGLIPYNRNSKQKSRDLRNKQTEAERILWERLRNKHTGYHFYRQKPVGDYIVDFYCPKKKLIVEVDGANHFTNEGKENDKARDDIMVALGFLVLRFSNMKVLKNTDKVVEKIAEKISLYPSL